MLLALLLACAPEEPVADDLSVCAAPSPVEIGVISAMQFAPAEDGVSRGFDLDGATTELGDDAGCGIPDMVGPEGEPGIDNALARLMPALQGTEAEAVELIVQEAIDTGALLLLFEAQDLDSTQDDGCVDLSLVRGAGEAVVGTWGRIEPGQTFDRDPDAEVSTAPGATVVGGLLRAGPLDLRLELSYLDAELDFRVHDIQLGLRWEEDGTSTGVFGGGVEIAYLMEVVTSNGVDPELAETLEPLLRSAADLAPDEDGECTQISVTFDFEAVPAFFFDD